MSVNNNDKKRTYALKIIREYINLNFSRAFLFNRSSFRRLKDNNELKKFINNKRMISKKIRFLIQFYNENVKG